MGKKALISIVVLWITLLIISPVAIYKINKQKELPKETKQIVHQTITQNQQQATLVFTNTKIPVELSIKEITIECETGLFKSKCKQDYKQLIADCIWFTSVSILDNTYIRCITLKENGNRNP